jgi:hypothetical protein
MPKQIHYEVFVRRGTSPSWALIDANERRDEALELARDKMAGGFVSGVKVVKETYDDSSGDYISLVIFEEGARKIKTRKEEEDAPPILPCLTPDDLYSVHSRQTLTRLFSETLARWKQTVTEMIHRADSLEKLEATGTLFQHAVQKIAIAQGNSTGVPIAQVIRSVNELADRAIQRVYREEKSGKIMVCKTAAELAVFAETRQGAPDAVFIIGTAFAKYLAPAPSWSTKLSLVLAVIASPPAEGKGRTILLGLCDAVVGEILGGSAALQELIGPMPDLGSALIAMSELYLGRVSSDQNSVLGQLSSFFGKDKLLDARTALGRRVLAELKTHKKLAETVEVEMRHLRAITSRLVLGPPRLVPHQDIVSAITIRSRRLVQPEIIGEYLAPAASNLIERAMRLLALEENIIGAENKRRIWDFLKPILTSAPFEATLLDPKQPPFDRLARAATLQSRVLKSGLTDGFKAEASALIDQATVRILEPGRIAALLSQPERAPTMMVTLYQALISDAVPQGSTSSAICEALSAHVSGGVLLRALIGDAERRGETDPSGSVVAGLARLGLIKPPSAKSAA